MLLYNNLFVVAYSYVYALGFQHVRHYRHIRISVMVREQYR